VSLQSSLSIEMDLLDDSDEEKRSQERTATGLCVGRKISGILRQNINILHQKKN